jgi:DNA replication and repair protein RecF
VTLNGAPLRSAEALRSELSTLVFTPDRLSVVKGGPGVRRAYFDRVVGRLFPARATVPLEYAAAVGQRNALLRRASFGSMPDLDALAPWTRQVAQLGTSLVAARREVMQELSPGFAAAAGELGLDAVRLEYDAEPPTETALDARRARDLERGTTGLGPHLDDVGVLSRTRDRPAFGSQGVQRLAVLALPLAVAELLHQRRSEAPLVLLDDVLSELDAGRRRALAERVARLPQAVITATGADALPVEPSQALEVTPGRVAEVA